MIIAMVVGRKKERDNLEVIYMYCITYKFDV